MNGNSQPHDAAPVVFRFNYDAHVLIRFKSVNLSAAVLYHFSDDTLHYAMTLTFDSVTLTSDPLTLDICSIGCIVVTVPNLNEFEQYAAVLLRFQYLTHWTCHGGIFSKCKLSTYPFVTCDDFWCWYIMSRCEFDLWPVDLEHFKYIMTCVMWSTSVRNLSDIQ